MSKREKKLFFELMEYLKKIRFSKTVQNKRFRCKNVGILYAEVYVDTNLKQT